MNYRTQFHRIVDIELSLIEVAQNIQEEIEVLKMVAKMLDELAVLQAQHKAQEANCRIEKRRKELDRLVKRKKYGFRTSVLDRFLRESERSYNGITRIK